jgi:hypothetical protein
MRTSGRVLMTSRLLFSGCTRSSTEMVPTYVSPDWTLGLLRVWAILSSLWVATMTGSLTQYVFLMVLGEPHSPFQHVPVSACVIIALGPPSVLFALGFAGVWIARSLRRPMLNFPIQSPAPF